VCLANAQPSLSAQSTTEAVARVVDGDTLEVDGIRYRLHGIDAPEAGQSCAASDGREWRCGQAAIQHMEKLTAGKSVRCDDRGTDGYGRTIGVCTADGVDLNAAMVDTGMAWAFRKYSMDYAQIEDVARSRRVGVWQAPTETAWEFRAHKWTAALAEAPTSGCPIKGNINKKSERIYHAPWSRDYAKTKINVSHGERWFCTEEEAVAAGWRAPQWGNR
jgi:endonuclease YncB( thermonuclease family)